MSEFLESLRQHLQSPLMGRAEESSNEIPRGISPEILFQHVLNTAPFLFTENFSVPYVANLKCFRARLKDSEAPLLHAQYFTLCLSAHHATVATYVPTDVDNQIRFRLWHPALDLSIIGDMAKIVSESRFWDPSPVSRRLIVSDNEGILSGHSGEWFSTAVAAYGALRKRSPSEACQVLAEIEAEVKREARIAAECIESGDGVRISKAAVIISHNLGDLDRVVEMWNLPEEDDLRKRFFKCGHALAEDFRKPLFICGELYKAMLAVESHRNFALRRPKCLRRGSDFLLPTAPFLDDWGAMIARHPGLEPREVGEIAEALVDGFEWLAKSARDNGAPTPVGYARALAGILENFPGGESMLFRELPARLVRSLRSGQLHQLRRIQQRRFEASWSAMALKYVRNS